MNERLESLLAGIGFILILGLIGLYAVDREELQRRSWRASIEQVEILKKFQGEKVEEKELR